MRNVDNLTRQVVDKEQVNNLVGEKVDIIVKFSIYKTSAYCLPRRGLLPTANVL